MTARNSIAILDSMFDLFKEMGSGVTLGMQTTEVARRLRWMRDEVDFTPDIALAANKLRSSVAFYATRFVPHPGDGDAVSQNQGRLDEVVTAYSELRNHLEQRAATEPECPACGTS